MKKYFSLIFFLYLTSSVDGQMDIKNYLDSISKAEKLFRSNKYIESATLYSKTFLQNNDLGRISDRYKAASCWALIGIADSAFYQLNKIVEKGNFSEEELIKADYNLITLQKDQRWKTLLGNIRLNKAKKEKKVNL